jgi:hypothetical protein
MTRERDTRPVREGERGEDERGEGESRGAERTHDHELTIYLLDH